MITELQKFREKYPQYGDMDDATLAQSLADKYPEYKDLPDKVAAESKPRGGVSGSFEKERMPISPYEDPEFRADVSEAISNFPGSAVQLAKDTYSAVRHPVQTAQAMGNLALGAGQKLIPGEQEKEPHVDAFVKGMVDRYGSMEALRETVIKDPAGFMADMSTLLSGGGTTLRAAGAITKSPTLGKIGKTVADAGMRVEPVNVAREGLRQPFKLVPDFVPKGMYESAAKFSNREGLSRKERSKLGDTALEQDVSLSTKGLDKLDDLLAGTNRKIDEFVDDASKTGRKMPVPEMFKFFDELENEFLSKSGKPLAGVAAIRKVQKDITEANKRLGRTDLSAREVQDMKKYLYQELKKEYSANRWNEASAKGRMAVARSQKEFLETIIPEIKELNAKDSDLISLMNELRGPVARVGNRDISGIGVPIKGAAGAATAGPAGFVAGTFFGLLDTPRIKAKLARVLYNLDKKGIKVRPTPTLLRLGLVQGGRASSVQDDTENP